MNNNFMEWIQNRKILVNEESDPKVGDHVYFGIHDLIRNNFNLDRDSMHQKMGQIADVDPVKERIKVSVDQDPYHFGYRKLESPHARDKRKKMSKDGRSEVSIPHHDCKDISDMVGDGSKVWLVVDRNTKYQSGLNHKLNQFKYMSKGPSYMTGDVAMPQTNTSANPNMSDPSVADQINPAMVPQGPNGQQQFGMGQPPKMPNQPPGMQKLPTMQLGNMNPNARWRQVNRNVSYMNKECYDPLASIGWKETSKDQKFYKYY